MKRILILSLSCLLCCLGFVQTPVAAETSASRDRIEPVRLATIELGGFWKQQAKRLTEQWLPHCIRQMEKGGRGQELLNLDGLGPRAAGRASRTGNTPARLGAMPTFTTRSRPSASRWRSSPTATPNSPARRRSFAPSSKSGFRSSSPRRRPDGYIHSFHVLNQHPRYSNVGWHEFYVMGYFLEMGVAHYRMTGGKDRRLYDAAVRCGDHLCATFGPPPKRTWRNGHPGMEYALCRLGRLVNEVEGAGKGDKYIQLARHFLDHQHEGEKPNEYNQSDKPAVELSEAKGHAVRATYFYTAMTDIALHQRNAAYQQAVDSHLDERHPQEALPHRRRGGVPQRRGVCRRLRVAQRWLLRVVRRLRPELLGRPDAPAARGRPLPRCPGTRALQQHPRRRRTERHEFLLSESAGREARPGIRGTGARVASATFPARSSRSRT